MIAIIDYDAGNTMSVMNSLDRIGIDYILTSNSEKILGADKVIFPGVGNAGRAMQSLMEKDLVSVIQSITKPLLGICVGMQLLYDKSEESDTTCLGIIEGEIKKFENSKCIIPQVGWNKNKFEEYPIFDRLDTNSWMYSVHSYRADICNYTIATANYGGEYASAVKKDNFYGVQFHPEKSAKSGHQLMKNFIKL